MPRLLAIFTLCFVLISCSENKIVLLPEIKKATITDIKDVSPAYIFYDETQPDSTLLNRKNLIISTNWLVNVDKRLTLRQVMPHITFLQDKKRNAQMHKNENAKNYFTCNDTGINNLGFLEFTDVIYNIVDIKDDSSNIRKLQSKDYYQSKPFIDAFITVSVIIDEQSKVQFYNEKLAMEQYIEELSLFPEKLSARGFSLELYFNNQLTFQDYISIKLKLSKLNSEKFIIDKHEIIYN